MKNVWSCKESKFRCFVIIFFLMKMKAPIFSAAWLTCFLAAAVLLLHPERGLCCSRPYCAGFCYNTHLCNSKLGAFAFKTIIPNKAKIEKHTIRHNRENSAVFRKQTLSAAQSLQHTGSTEEEELYPLPLTEDTALLPGSRLLLPLDESGVDAFRRMMRRRNSPTVGICFTQHSEDLLSEDELAGLETQLCPKEEDNAVKKAMPALIRNLGNFFVYPVGVVGEVLTPLPKGFQTPIASIKIASRIRILEAAYMGDTYRARVSLYEDFPITKNIYEDEYIIQSLSAIHSLYARANEVEATLMKLENREDLEKICRLRSTLSQRVEDSWGTDNGNFNLLEALAFAAMEDHFDASAKYWALEETDSEKRLSFVLKGLKEKLHNLEKMVEARRNCKASSK